MKNIILVVSTLFFIATTSFAQHKVETVKYTCTMHKEVRMDRPGKCPICGMTLVPVKQVATKKIVPAHKKDSTAKKQMPGMAM